jgi:hypothetical protein
MFHGLSELTLKKGRKVSRPGDLLIKNRSFISLEQIFAVTV